MKKSEAVKMKKGIVLTMLLCIALVSSAMHVSATATTEVNVTKYAANNYSTVLNETTTPLNYTWMEDNFSQQYSNGPVYMQGPSFDSNDRWGDAGQNVICFYTHNGTLISDLVDYIKLSGEDKGMSPGDEIQIHANDGFSRWFNYTHVYEPHDSQRYMVLTWWDDYYGYVPNFPMGMRLYFYRNNTGDYGVDDSLNMTNREMYSSFGPWYHHNYTNQDGEWPSMKGLSVKYVDQLKIYPPHLHDFDDTGADAGDTTGWAFRYQTSGSPPSAPNDPNTEFTSAQYANIADDDGTYKSDVTTSNNNYAAHQFNFSIDTSSAKDGPIADIEKLNVTWNGKGWHSASSSQKNGTDLYIYNYTSGSYGSAIASTTDGTEVYLTGEKTSGISSYISSTNNVTVLVKQKNYQKSNGLQSGRGVSHIETDYVNMTVTHHHHN